MAGDARRPRGRGWAADRRERRPKPPVLRIGLLPIARRDSERLRQVLSVPVAARDLESSPRAKRVLIYRAPFEDALTWLEVHGQAPEIVEHWRGFIEATGAGRRPDGPGGGERPNASDDAPPAPARWRRRALPAAHRGMSDPGSAPYPRLPFELPHEVDEGVDAGLGKRVVDRGAHAAHRTVALQAVEPGGGRLLHELLLQLLAAPAGT